jgi:hypothetical protein
MRTLKALAAALARRDWFEAQALIVVGCLTFRGVREPQP